MTSSAALRRRIAQLMRYAATSVVATTTSLLTLTALVGSGTMRPVSANLIATFAGTVPSFELNRRWVWSVGGRPSVRRQVLPFLGLTFAGLAASTVLIAAVSRLAEHARLGHGETAVLVAIADLVGFGTVWVIQFIVLDRVLFKPVSATSVAEEPALAR
jgi:putative flippase GtrA